MKYLAIWLIRLYQLCDQLCVGPFVGNPCRFFPSCSEYALEAFQKHGFFYGSWLMIKRLIKCGPWCLGGHDPVP